MVNGMGRRRGQAISAWSLGAMVVLGMGLLVGCAGESAVPAAPEAEAAPPTVIANSPPEPVLGYQTYPFSDSLVHVVTVPPNQGWQLSIGLSETLAPLADLAEAAGAIAAINAGFFDPQNGQTTSYVILDGAIAADPRQNDRLMGNPDLQTYLPAILNRSEFRIYDCRGTSQYDIVAHEAPVPAGCQLGEAIGAGPQLLPAMTGAEEAFWADDAAGNRIRDALGSGSPNARSAIGIKPDGTVVLAIAAQVPTQAPGGLTLFEMADFLADIGVQKALNLDGGSSTGLYLNGETYPGRLDAQGNPIERPIKSILYVQP